MMHSLARMLPDSISVLSMQRVPPDFHARYTAQRKVYHYHLHVGHKVDPFTRWHRGTVLGPIDLPAMRYALQLLHAQGVVSLCILGFSFLVGRKGTQHAQQLLFVRYGKLCIRRQCSCCWFAGIRSLVSCSRLSCYAF